MIDYIEATYKKTDEAKYYRLQEKIALIVKNSYKEKTKLTEEILMKSNEMNKEMIAKLNKETIDKLDAIKSDATGLSAGRKRKRTKRRSTRRRKIRKRRRTSRR